MTHLVHTNGLAINLDHVHDFYSIVSIIFTHELNEPVTLVLLSDAIPRHVHVDCVFQVIKMLRLLMMSDQNSLTNWTSLQEQLPEHVLCDLFIQPTHIHSCICKMQTLDTFTKPTAILFHLDSAPESVQKTYWTFSSWPPKTWMVCSK